MLVGEREELHGFGWTEVAARETASLHTFYNGQGAFPLYNAADAAVARRGAVTWCLQYMLHVPAFCTVLCSSTFHTIL